MQKLVFAETDMEKVNALLYQAMFDETIRLRTCISMRERQQIREFIKEAYELYVEQNLQNEKQYVEEVRGMQKVDELIEKLAVHISEIISSGKVNEEGEIAEKTLALAELISARANMD